MCWGVTESHWKEHLRGWGYGFLFHPSSAFQHVPGLLVTLAFTTVYTSFSFNTLSAYLAKLYQIKSQVWIGYGNYCLY